jgi:hypothetical protein
MSAAPVSTTIDITFHLVADNGDGNEAVLRDPVTLQSWLLQGFYPWFGENFKALETFSDRGQVYLGLSGLELEDKELYGVEVASHAYKCPIHDAQHCQAGHSTVELTLQRDAGAESFMYVTPAGGDCKKYTVPRGTCRAIALACPELMSKTHEMRCPTPEGSSASVSSGASTNATSSNHSRPSSNATAARKIVGVSPEGKRKPDPALPERAKRRRGSPVPSPEPSTHNSADSVRQAFGAIPYRPIDTVSDGGTTSKLSSRKSSRESLVTGFTAVTNNNYQSDSDSEYEIVPRALDLSTNTGNVESGKHP